MERRQHLGSSFRKKGAARRRRNQCEQGELLLPVCRSRPRIRGTDLAASMGKHIGSKVGCRDRKQDARKDIGFEAWKRLSGGDGSLTRCSDQRACVAKQRKKLSGLHETIHSLVPLESQGHIGQRMRGSVFRFRLLVCFAMLTKSTLAPLLLVTSETHASVNDTSRSFPRSRSVNPLTCSRVTAQQHRFFEQHKGRKNLPILHARAKL